MTSMKLKKKMNKGQVYIYIYITITESWKINSNIKQSQCTQIN